MGYFLNYYCNLCYWYRQVQVVCNINWKWNTWLHNIKKVEEKRTRTKNDWCQSEETMKSQMIDWHFVNQVFVVWISDFNMRLCNFAFNYIWLSPLMLLFTPEAFLLKWNIGNKKFQQPFILRIYISISLKAKMDNC